jgi:hypothetical protein
MLVERCVRKRFGGSGTATLTPRWTPISPNRCANTVEPHSEHDTPFISQSDIDIFAGQSGSGAQSGEVHDWWAEGS